MAQTKSGALKSAAKKIGITVSEYLTKIKNGLKWCFGCKQWHPYTDFGLDSTRSDGLSPGCLQYRKSLYRKTYEPRLRKSKKGCRFVPVRDGDKLQARARVNHLVSLGLLPNPNTLVCARCGGEKKAKRNEYHHHKGYEKEYHENVIVLCAACHRENHPEQTRKRNEKGQFC